MGFLKPFTACKRATAADQATKMEARREPVQGSTVPKTPPQQGTRRQASDPGAAAGGVGGVRTAHDHMVSDHAGDGRGVYASKQSAAQSPLEHSRDVPQSKAS